MEYDEGGEFAWWGVDVGGKERKSMRAKSHIMPSPKYTNVVNDGSSDSARNSMRVPLSRSSTPLTAYKDLLPEAVRDACMDFGRTAPLDAAKCMYVHPDISIVMYLRYLSHWDTSN
jgi:hypothetical protein